MPDSVKRFLRHSWDNLQIIVIALAAAFFVRYFIAQPFLVSGASMEPSFHDGNFLIVDELTYRLKEPERGDVIVFKYPGNEKEYFIKRIIGIPGETIVTSGDVITITAQDGTMTTLVEPYIKPDLRIAENKSVTLSEKEYFVMGDNRGNSFDSRSWGPLNQKEITGLVRLRVFPFNEFGITPDVTY